MTLLEVDQGKALLKEKLTSTAMNPLKTDTPAHQDVNVLFLWKVPPTLMDYFKTRFSDFTSLNLVFPTEASESEFLKHAPTAHIIVGWRPSEELLARAEHLKLFIFPGAGVQHLIAPFRDFDPGRGIVLVNGHGNAYFVAQHAVALLLALMNKVVPHHLWMVAGVWRQGDPAAKTIPLRHRKIGLLGYGAINQRVHTFLTGYDVKFSILRRSWAGKTAPLPTPATKYEPSQLHEFLKEIDTLIVAIPQTSETEGMLGLSELKLLGPNGLLVNVARGSIIDQESLYQVLDQKLITGAAIDVWYTYQPKPDAQGRRYPFDFPFHELDNVILSPHRAASPFDDLERWDDIIENIRRFALNRRDLLNVINLERGY